MSHDNALDALIATAKAQDVPPEGAEDQAWAAFAGSLGGGGGGGGTEVATAAGAKGVGLAIKVAVGVALTSVAAVGVARWSAPRDEEPAEPTVSAERLPAPVSVAVPVAPQVASVAAAPVVAPEPPPVVAPTEPLARTKSSSSPPPESAVPPTGSTLAQEAKLVGSMWKALDGGEAERALSLAQAHGVRFKGGALSLEARAAALAARCALGRPTDLRELEGVKKAATPAVAKRISSACAKKP